MAASLRLSVPVCGLFEHTDDTAHWILAPNQMLFNTFCVIQETGSIYKDL